MNDIRVQHHNWSSRIGTAIVIIAFFALVAAPWWAERDRRAEFQDGDGRTDGRIGPITLEMVGEKAQYPQDGVYTHAAIFVHHKDCGGQFRIEFFR